MLSLSSKSHRKKKGVSLSSEVRRRRRQDSCLSFCRSMKEASSSSSKSCRCCCYPIVTVEDLTTILHRIPSPMVSIVATPLRRSSRE
ncbi:hypothetical protein ACFX2F_039705 [Malus domestica]